MLWKVSQDILDDWICGVGSASDAEVDFQSVAGVVLLECRGQALIQVWLKALAGSDDSDGCC